MDQPTDKCRRNDATLASLIDVALVYQETLGYPSAKVYLMEHGIPKDMIRRVLAMPGQRRSADVLELNV
jgi:hypothetical protein